MFINMSNSPFHPMGLILLSVPLYRQGNSDHKGLNDLPQVNCSGQRQDLNPDVLAVELSSKHYTLVPNCYCNNYNFWKVLNHFSHVQLFATLDCSPPCSSVHGFLQARILECVAMPSSREVRRSRPDPVIKPVCLPSPELAGRFFCLRSPELAGRFFTTRATWEAHSFS